ncbi:MAG: hypothetical protein M3209_07090 [Acidobacteriota bacterium]|nr:hypothetical protein [Acidobacteriota bacterium]
MNFIYQQLTAILFAVLVFGTSVVDAQTEKTNNVTQPIEIKLEHDVLGKAPTINVQVGDKIYPFLFDTGGGITTITPAIAKEIGCEPFGQITGFNAGGTRLDFKRCDDIGLKLGNFSTRVNTGTFEIMHFFSPDTKEIGGFISLQTFANRTITIDLSGNRLIVETESSAAERVKDMKALESRIGSQGGGAIIDIFVAANTPKGKIWMEFDTGNFSGILFSPHAQEMLGINFDAPNRAKMSKPVKLDIIGLGTIEMPARERNMIYDGMLNYDTISKWIVTIDLKTGKMWAKIKPEQSKEQPK